MYVVIGKKDSINKLSDLTNKTLGVISTDKEIIEISQISNYPSFIDTSKNREHLKRWFDNRMLYVVVTSAVSGYFNPINKESYREKRRKG